MVLKLATIGFLVLGASNDIVFKFNKSKIRINFKSPRLIMKR
jgi:hypothetical protein